MLEGKLSEGGATMPVLRRGDLTIHQPAYQHWRASTVCCAIVQVTLYLGP